MPIPRITVEELKTKLEKKEELAIIDVRADDSYNSSHVKIKGALRITLDELEKDVKSVPQGKDIIITYCT